jgi:hypothetical protein
MESENITENKSPNGIIHNHNHNHNYLPESESKPNNDSKESKKSFIKPDDIDSQLWDDLKKQRAAQKAPITETVINIIRNEAEKAGIDANTAIKEMLARGWRGFKASWYIKENGKNTQSNETGFTKDLLEKLRAEG